MLRYRTRDQIIVRLGTYIPPYTEVEVHEQDKAVWDELVSLKVAEKVEETPPEEVPPPIPTRKRKKKSAHGAE